MSSACPTGDTSRVALARHGRRFDGPKIDLSPTHEIRTTKRVGRIGDRSDSVTCCNSCNLPTPTWIVRLALVFSIVSSHCL